MASMKVLKQLTLSKEEDAILQVICRRFGWTESKALQIMFFDFCNKQNLVTEFLHGNVALKDPRVDSTQKK
jgi:hypothetical protein